MKRWIPLSTATTIYYAITIIALVYHVLILTRIVDYKNAWGGRLESLEQMYTFETVSIIMQLLFAGIIYLKATREKGNVVYRVLQVLTFLIAILFILNTVGNLFAITWFERLVFTPLTLILSIVSFRIAIE